jgi:4-hydroxybenzoate polyprenyltransferase
MPSTRARKIAPSPPAGSPPLLHHHPRPLLCATAFIAATALFGFYKNILPVLLSLPVLLFISAYPFLKRFTQLCHYYLGAALALAPICSWIAIKGKSPAPPADHGRRRPLLDRRLRHHLRLPGLRRSDLETKTFSIPARVGIKNALWIARRTHVLAAALLITLGLITPQFGIIYFIAVGLSILLLIYQHAIVKPT